MLIIPHPVTKSPDASTQHGVERPSVNNFYGDNTERKNKMFGTGRNTVEIEKSGNLYQQYQNSSRDRESENKVLIRNPTEIKQIRSENIENRGSQKIFFHYQEEGAEIPHSQRNESEEGKVYWEKRFEAIYHLIEIIAEKMEAVGEDVYVIEEHF